jgi:hypothetical protein
MPAGTTFAVLLREFLLGRLGHHDEDDERIYGGWADLADDCGASHER